MKQLALTAALLFAACSSSVALDDFCAQSASVNCEVNKRCHLWESAMACPDSPDTTCTERMQQYVDAGVLHYDGAEAKRCLDAMAQRSCDDVLHDPTNRSVTACMRTLVGEGKEGEACGGCEEGLVCSVSLGSADLCGTCAKRAPPAADGASCANATCGFNSECVDGVCAPLPGDGEACRFSRCHQPLRCRNNACLRPLGLGASCFDDEMCQTGLWCDDGVCQLTGVNGVACEFSVECRSGICADGHCADLSPVGAPCGPGCAKPGVCVNETCVRSAELGEPCVNSTCALGVCWQGVCRDGVLQCG